MARRRFQFLSGQFYHVYNRGANRDAIFKTEKNYQFLLKRFEENLPSFRTSMIAYCLMPNHYHFLLRQDDEIPISRLMQAVFNSYTKAYNKAYDHSGTLFEGPFKAIAIDKFDYLLHLSRYIHRNPMDAGLVSHPGEWPFSSYLDWIGKRDRPITDKGFIRDAFPRPEEYEEFVLDYELPARISDQLKKLTFE